MSKAYTYVSHFLLTGILSTDSGGILFHIAHTTDLAFSEDTRLDATYFSEVCQALLRHQHSQQWLDRALDFKGFGEPLRLQCAYSDSKVCS